MRVRVLVALALVGRSVYGADAAQTLVNRLDLGMYKETIQGLAKFGDRLQGTARNRAAVDWIAGQLKSYGCQPERLKYEYRDGFPPQDASPLLYSDSGINGVRMRGPRGATFPNTNPEKQTDPKLRALNTPRAVPGAREEVYCTKVGSKHPEEMYLVTAHLDGMGGGEAVNDDASGAALVMELARILSSPEVETERSIRFVFFNNEETGFHGAQAYIDQRRGLQGKESPAGSGRYPEPKWLGIIQHDMLLFDHGRPQRDGTVGPEQRPEADINVEFHDKAKFANDSASLAWAFHRANETYSEDYPATVGPHMRNTDSAPFQDIVAAISVRENERGAHIGAGWDPHWHQPTDLFATFSDADFRLGLNAAQMTLGAVAELAGVTIRR